MYEYTLHAAAVTGELWWPIGEPAYKEGPWLAFVRHDKAARPFMDTYETLREAVQAMEMREGGDFSTAPLLAAPLLTVKRIGRTHTTVRTFDLSKSRTIADYIDRDWSGFPMMEGE